MFTGLIETIGVAEKINKRDKGARLSVKRPSFYTELRIGESISVNGVCLTIVNLEGQSIVFDVMQETLERSNIGSLKNGDSVNLERAMKAGDRLGGHFVTGHIDYNAPIKALAPKGDDTVLTVFLPKEYRVHVVPKGSVALDGVSLTVGEVSIDSFAVYLIPHTLEHTTLGLKTKGSIVNVETDVLAKYVFGAQSVKAGSGINEGFLKEHGFMR